MSIIISNQLRNSPKSCGVVELVRELKRPGVHKSQRNNSLIQRQIPGETNSAILNFNKQFEKFFDESQIVRSWVKKNPEVTTCQKNLPRHWSRPGSWRGDILPQRFINLLKHLYPFVIRGLKNAKLNRCRLTVSL